MSILTLDQGTFAGQTIRITPDHYASIYDVIKVAGVGSNPYTVWTDIKMKISDFQTTSILPTSAFATPPASGQTSSEEVPMIKTYKFTGRGQRK